ncbi:MAG: Hsp20/alpha crystallin family protein [Pseudomonadota bacterium]
MPNRQITPQRRGSLAGTGSPFGSGGRGGSLFDLHHQMNRLFDDLFDRGGLPATGASGSRATMSAPALEVHQTDDLVEITAELPGVREEDIDLQVEDGVLTLSGEKRSHRTDQEHGYSERSYGRFERTISLPANIDEDACRAEFRDGVLRIALPRAAEKQRGRKIPLGGTGVGGTQQVGQQQPAAHNDSKPAPSQMAAQKSPGSTGQQGSGGQGSGGQGSGGQGSSSQAGS